MSYMLQIITEPLITIEVPSRPWEKVASDLYEFKGTSYILVVDYFSRFIESQNSVQPLSPTLLLFLSQYLLIMAYQMS